MAYVASGGLEYPDIPGLADVVVAARATAEAVETAAAAAETPMTSTTPISTSWPTVTATLAATPTPVPVYLAFFFGLGCPKCREARLALAQIQEGHPNLHIDSCDIRERRSLAHWMAGRYGVDQARRDQVPAVYVDQDVLIGDAVSARAMLALVEKYAAGGANAMWVPGRWRLSLCETRWWITFGSHHLSLSWHERNGGTDVSSSFLFAGAE
ncbi:MAG TPA: hypothetical protein EYP04_05525 [Anaerolineae bacterium]|nr:hypothetical protein [Anaerolineae bacterium]HIQ06796.1 hypothetical protein [Anaerolineae bacterium]